MYVYKPMLMPMPKSRPKKMAEVQNGCRLQGDVSKKQPAARESHRISREMGTKTKVKKAEIFWN